MKIILIIVSTLLLLFSCSENFEQKKIISNNPVANLSADSILKRYQEKFKNEGKVNLGEMAKKMYIADSSNPVLAIHYSTCLLANAHTAESNYLCRKAISIDSNFSEAYWNLGMAFMSTNRDSGYYYFDKAISKNPDWYYYFWLSKYHAEDSLYKEALNDINIAIKKHPNQLDLILFRGNYKSYIGDYRGALSDFKNIPTHRINDPDIYANIANSHLFLKEYEKTIEYCNKSLSINPNHVGALSLRASAKTNIDKPYEALEDLKKCAELGNAECSHYYELLKESLSKNRQM